MEVNNLPLIWREWKDFNGQFDFYTFKTKGTGDGYSSGLVHHRGLIAKRVDTDATLKIDLLVRDGRWNIKIERGEWNPTNGNYKVQRSQHDWNPAMVVYALYIFSNKFGSWNLLLRNCWSFASGLQKYMTNHHRDCKTQANIENLEDLSQRLIDLDLILIQLPDQQQRNHN